MAKKKSNTKPAPALIQFPELTPKSDLTCRVLLDDQILLVDVRAAITFMQLPQPKTRFVGHLFSSGMQTIRQVR
jgi:hypothetical protein